MCYSLGDESALHHSPQCLWCRVRKSNGRGCPGFNARGVSGLSLRLNASNQGRLQGRAGSKQGWAVRFPQDGDVPLGRAFGGLFVGFSQGLVADIQVRIPVTLVCSPAASRARQRVSPFPVNQRRLTTDLGTLNARRADRTGAVEGGEALTCRALKRSCRSLFPPGISNS